MAHLLLMTIGALLPTLLVSRLTLWLMRSSVGGSRRLIFAHAISFAALGLLVGIGKVSHGALAAFGAISVYAVPQAFWFWVDTLRERWGARIPPGGFADGPFGASG